MLLRRLPLFLFTLALSVLPARGQMEPRGRSVYSIDGFVRDDSGQHPMEYVRVDLKNAGGTPLTTTFTRGNGEFDFEGIPSGEYVLEVNVKDYEPVRQSVSVFNSSAIGVNVFLSKTTKAPNPIMGATISAHQLSVPHKAYDEFEKGMTLFYVKSDYRGAIDQFQRAIKDFPSYYEAYSEEGGAYYLLGEMGPAEEALRKSIDVSAGKYPDPFFTLAALLNDAKRFSDAEEIARRGIAADNSSWRGPLELARALAALKQPEEAEKSARRSRDLMPDNPSIYLVLANIHIQKKDYSSLLKDLDEFLRLAPNSPEADRARKTREEVKARLEEQETESASDEDEDAQPQRGEKESPNASGKTSPPPPDPDTSGLPSLPPPNPANP